MALAPEYSPTRFTGAPESADAAPPGAVHAGGTRRDGELYLSAGGGARVRKLAPRHTKPGALSEVRVVRYHEEARLELLHEVGYYSAVSARLGERFDKTIQTAAKLQAA